MAIAWYEGGAKATGMNVARLSIPACGVATMSPAAVQAGKFSAGNYVKIGFDRKARLLVIVHTEKEDAAARMIATAAKSLQLGLFRMLRSFGILYCGKLPLHHIDKRAVFFGPIPPEERT